MVGTDPVRVDGLLAAGQLRCPECSGRLRPWGHAGWRAVREVHAVVRHRPRRSCCSGCGGTHCQASSIRRYIAWRNRHAHDKLLRQVVTKASTIKRAKVA